MIRVGIDLVEVERIQKSLENPRFLTRVFGLAEQALFCGAPQRQWERAAANFAAKEAFAKALGTGIRGFSLTEVETLRRESGEPYLSLSGKAAELAKGLRFSVSLTHVKEYAQAIVIAEEIPAAEASHESDCAANVTSDKSMR